MLMLYVLCLILKYQLDVINNKITSGIIINYFICNEIIIFKIFNLINNELKIILYYIISFLF